jgi:hypothetical protein
MSKNIGSCAISEPLECRRNIGLLIKPRHTLPSSNWYIIYNIWNTPNYIISNRLLTPCNREHYKCNGSGMISIRSWQLKYHREGWGLSEGGLWCVIWPFPLLSIKDGKIHVKHYNLTTAAWKKTACCCSEKKTFFFAKERTKLFI